MDKCWLQQPPPSHLFFSILADYLLCCEAHAFTQDSFFDVMDSQGWTRLCAPCSDLCIGCRCMNSNIESRIDPAYSDDSNIEGRTVW